MLSSDMAFPMPEYKCTWHPKVTEQDKANSPHACIVRETPKILPNVLSQIGGTPLIRVNKIAADYGLECELLVKCEFFNAGGSVKDRIGLRMVQEAEESGRIKKGDCLIEPTSGNTGIGLALAAAVRGYRCIIVLPEKMSNEKVNILKALGAEIVRTPTEAASDSPESHISVAARLNKEIPNSHILDQYINPANPLSHYDGTGEEILFACDDKVDMLVAGVGTGGTISGIARKLKERCPDVKIIGVDPHGSILAQPESLNSSDIGYEVEGIGYDFIPTVLQRNLVDEWYKVHDKESLLMSRRLIRDEGLLCGGSSGSAMSVAVQAAKSLKKGQRCVVVLPDSIRNYMTKFLSNDWMIERNFIDDAIMAEMDGCEWWSTKTVSDLKLTAPVTIPPSMAACDAVKILKNEGFGQLPVVDASDELLGVITEGNLLANMARKKVGPSDPVETCMYKRCKQIDLSMPLYRVSKMLDSEHFVLVITEQKAYQPDGRINLKKIIVGIITRIDLLQFIANEQK